MRTFLYVSAIGVLAIAMTLSSWKMLNITASVRFRSPECVIAFRRCHQSILVIPLRISVRRTLWQHVRIPGEREPLELGQSSKTQSNPIMVDQPLVTPTELIAGT